MSSYTVKKTPGDTEWFRESRFGMFIHFGLYSMPARHEWMKHRECTPEEKYNLYFKHFNPDLYDPKDWARQAKNAGMKYVVFTTKHHEGFCLWDSKCTNYKVTNTPYGKDFLKEFVDAFRAEGIRIGLYYSLIDWNHPDFPIDTLHPRRNDPDAAELDKGRDMPKYAAYMREQVKELLSNYGKIDIMWFDFSYPGSEGPDGIRDWMQFGGGKNKDEWESEKLLSLCREMMPGIIIDNRAGIDQDLWTPEQYQPNNWLRDPETGEYLTWEACQTFSGSWGYYRDEMDWKSPEMLINMLINTVSYGGNLILNVGPTPRGYFDYRAEEALKVYAEWMKYHSRSIYGCTMAEPEFTAPAGTRLTQSLDGKRLYIHLLTYPFGCLKMSNLADKIEYAQFLSDGSEVLFSEEAFELHSCNTSVKMKGEIAFTLPTIKPHTLVPVIEVFLK